MKLFRTTNKTFIGKQNSLLTLFGANETFYYHLALICISKSSSTKEAEALIYMGISKLSWMILIEERKVCDFLKFDTFTAAGIRGENLQFKHQVNHCWEKGKSTILNLSLLQMQVGSRTNNMKLSSQSLLMTMMT